MDKILKAILIAALIQCQLINKNSRGLGKLKRGIFLSTFKKLEQAIDNCTLGKYR